MLSLRSCTSLALTFFYCTGKYIVAKLIRLLAPHYTQSGIIPFLLSQTFAKSTAVLVKNTDFNSAYVTARNKFVFRRVRKTAKIDYYLRHVCPSVYPSVRLSFRLSIRPSVRPSDLLSVPTEQLGSHWTDFREVLHLNIFRKFVEKIQFSVKYDEHNGYFT